MMLSQVKTIRVKCDNLYIFEKSNIVSDRKRYKIHIFMQTNFKRASIPYSCAVKTVDIFFKRSKKKKKSM